MKKQILLILLFIIVGTTNAQINYLMWSDVNIVRFGKETLFKNSDNKFLNGRYKIAENSGAYSEITFNQGKIIGEKKDYDFTGKISAISHYKDGNADGKNVSFYQSGKIGQEGFYKNGEKDGTWKTYDKKGALRSTENYKNGLKDGTWKEEVYYPQTGKTSTVTEYYKDNKRRGTWTEIDSEQKVIWTKKYKTNTNYEKKKFYPNEKLASQENYVDRLLDGEAVYYNQDGLLLVKTVYKKGHIVFEKEYYENGKIKKLTYYKNGNKHGMYKRYNKDGVLKKEGIYADGYKSGEWKNYDNHGELLSTYTYRNDVKNGISKHYNEAGTVESEGMFLNDEKDGIWKYYKLNGKLKKEVKYELGKEIFEKEYK